MDEASSATTVQTVVAAVTNAVRAGHLAPGQRLVESDFTRRLGVSRSSVREAFQRLAADGLLSFEPNRGVTVKQLSRKEVDNLFQVRGSLEALAVRLALPALSASPDRLLGLQHAMDDAIEAGQIEVFSKLNRRFHELFWEVSDNSFLTEILGKLGNSVYWLQFRVLVEPKYLAQANKEHGQLVRAVLASDSKAAEQVMLDHVETSRRRLQALADDYFKP